jgi:dCMP deaminase
VKRPSWDKTWMDVALVIARRSKCSRSNVGAVIVTSDNQLAAASYNGPAAGYAPAWTDEKGCESWCGRSSTRGSELGVGYGLTCPSIHAEANALLRADWSQIQGGTLYVTRSTCADCAKMVSNSGITRVVILTAPDSSDDHLEPIRVHDYLEGCGITVDTISPKAVRRDK